MEFLSWLFDSSDWPVRWYCGDWTTMHGWMHISANAIISLSYFAIPAELLLFAKLKRHTLDPRAMLYVWLSVAFVLACGFGHFVGGVLPFWYPAYRVVTLVDICTAAISLTASLGFILVLKAFCAYRSPEEYRLIAEAAAAAEVRLAEEAKIRSIYTASLEQMLATITTTPTDQDREAAWTQIASLKQQLATQLAFARRQVGTAALSSV